MIRVRKNRRSPSSRWVDSELLTEQKWLAARDMAEMLQVGLSTAYRMIESGEVPALRINRTVRVAKQDLENYLQAQMMEVTNDRSAR